MKLFHLCVVSVLCLASSLSAQFGFNIGPFSLLFNARHRDFEGPICYAISNQKRLEITVENKEKISSKEIKVTVKELEIEPHAFGTNQDGKPIIKGNVVKESLVKEVTVKYGDERFKETDEEEESGFFAGWFKSGEKTIDIRRIKYVDVEERSHFDIPKNYKGPKRSEMRVICQLPIEDGEE